MSSRSEEQRSINLAVLDEEESKLPLGNANADAEIENIQDPVQSLLHFAQKSQNRISPSIRMIPSRIRDLNPKVFDPRQVSIGPLHRKNGNLQAFEGQKSTFLHDLLKNFCPRQEQILKTCVQKVNASMDKIKACYGEGIKGYTDDEITEMMVMDGCFILEFIYQKYTGSFDGNMVIEPISMAFDLVLIENQIPISVLEDIFECTCPRFEPDVTSLPELILHAFSPAIGSLKSKIKIKKNKVLKETQYYHILGFIHDCYRPSIKGSSDSNKDVEKNQSSDSEIYYSANEKSDSEEDVEINGTSDSETFYSAVELDRAGVNFKPHHGQHDEKWPMDIELEFPLCFWSRPTLRMPVLRIHNYTELVLRNLIAYEQLSPRKVRHYVTSYAIAMDQLIDNHEDVARLVKSEVLVNTIGSNEEAAKLINDLRKGISCPHYYYMDVGKKMNGYHNRFWPRNIAKLRRTYFSNPWSIVALFAGIFLFLFTVVQTYYTVNPV